MALGGPTFDQVQRVLTHQANLTDLEIARQVGYGGVAVDTADVRRILTAHPDVFVLDGKRWRLKRAKRKAVPLHRPDRPYIDSNIAKPIPRGSRVRLVGRGWKSVYLHLGAQLCSPVVDHISLQVLSSGSPAQPSIEFDRVLESSTSFVAWSATGSWPNPTGFVGQGWHLWRSVDDVDWGYAERLLGEGDVDDAVLATYRTRAAIEASWGSVRLLIDGYGFATPDDLVLLTYECDEVEAQRRMHVLEVAAGLASGRPSGARRAAMTFCRVCGQPLSDPRSVARGLGPECYERIGGTPAARLVDLPPSQRSFRLGSKRLKDWRRSVKAFLALSGEPRSGSSP